MTDRTTFAQFTDAVRNCLALILHVSLARLAVKMSKIKELASQQEADVKRFAFLLSRILPLNIFSFDK